ncbi:MAG: hypothetical protein QGF53_01640 [Alphaproteobacteria bacterium]|jgi:WD40 repeat protein|nr:hypothetical protein [Alphaproteobacteria bacterium]
MALPALALGWPEAANAPGVGLTRWQIGCAATATAFTGDGEHAAFGFVDGSVRLVMLNCYDSRRMIGEAIHDGAVRTLAAGDGGEVASLGADGRAVMIDGGGFAAELYEPRADGQGALALDGRGGRFAVATPAGAWLLDAAGREIAHLETPPAAALALSPTTQTVAIGCRDSLLLWQPRDNAPPQRLESAAVHTLAWSGNGRRLAAGTDAATTACWTLDGEPEPATLIGRAGRLSWSSDGSALVGDGENGLYCWRPDGEPGKRGWHAPAQLTPMSGRHIDAIACHPNHGLVATAYDDGCVLLAELDGGAERLVRHATGTATLALAWSPDGTRLAAAGEKDVAIFDFREIEGDRP